MADKQIAKENAHRAIMVEVGHRYLKGNGVTLTSGEVWELVRNCATPEYGTYRLRNYLKGQTQTKSEYTLVAKKEPVVEEVVRKHYSTCQRPSDHKGKCGKRTKREM